MKKVNNIESIELELGHITSSSSDQYGNSSIKFQTFLCQFPDSTDDIRNGFIDKKVNCPYCSEIVKLVYTVDRIHLIEANKSNKEALMSFYKKRILRLSLSIWVIFQIIFWPVYFIFFSDQAVDYISICIGISIISLVLIGIITYLSTLAIIKSLVKKTGHLFVKQNIFKKVKLQISDHEPLDIIGSVHIWGNGKEHKIVNPKEGSRLSTNWGNNIISRGPELGDTMTFTRDNEYNIIERQVG
jgi:hypothetical protein